MNVMKFEELLASVEGDPEPFPRCESCIYFMPDYEECRRQAPTREDSDEIGFGYWPKTNGAIDWCGEWAGDNSAIIGIVRPSQ